jgi:hypothetical protein
MTETTSVTHEELEKIKTFFKNKWINRRISINCPYHYDTHKAMKVHGDVYRCTGYKNTGNLCNKTGKTANLIILLNKLLGDY